MKKAKSKEWQAHQGDVFVERVAALPDGATPRQGNAAGIIALGEATGHVHRVVGDVELYEKDGVVYARAKSDAKLIHTAGTSPTRTGDHADVVLPAGDLYRLTIQREYSPAEMRNVRD